MILKKKLFTHSKFWIYFFKYFLTLHFYDCTFFWGVGVGIFLHTHMNQKILPRCTQLGNDFCNTCTACCTRSQHCTTASTEMHLHRIKCINSFTTGCSAWIMRVSFLKERAREDLTFSAVWPVSMRRVLVSQTMTNMLLDPGLWPLVQFWLCWTDVMAFAQLWELCPGIEQGHPEKPHADPHPALPGCDTQTPTAGLLHHPCPHETLNPLLFGSRTFFP